MIHVFMFKYFNKNLRYLYNILNEYNKVHFIRLQSSIFTSTFLALLAYDMNMVGVTCALIAFYAFSLHYYLLMRALLPENELADEGFLSHGKLLYTKLTELFIKVRQGESLPIETDHYYMGLSNLNITRFRVIIAISWLCNGLIIGGVTGVQSVLIIVSYIGFMTLMNDLFNHIPSFDLSLSALKKVGFSLLVAIFADLFAMPLFINIIRHCSLTMVGYFAVCGVIDHFRPDDRALSASTEKVYLIDRIAMLLYINTIIMDLRFLSVFTPLSAYMLSVSSGLVMGGLYKVNKKSDCVVDSDSRAGTDCGRR